MKKASHSGCIDGDAGLRDGLGAVSVIGAKAAPEGVGGLAPEGGFERREGDEEPDGAGGCGKDSNSGHVMSDAGEKD